MEQQTDAVLREDVSNMTKSVSAIRGMESSGAGTDSSDAKGSFGKGVPIQNFDSLMAHMESLNVKFFN